MAKSELGWLLFCLSLVAGLVFVMMEEIPARFVFGTVVGYLLIHQLVSGRTLASLEKRLAELEASRADFKPISALQLTTPSPAPDAPTAPASPRPAADASKPASPDRAPPSMVRAPHTLTRTPSTVWTTPAEPNALERALGWGWAWLSRGNPVAKAGIVILFFGAAFLAKYAIDHAIVSIEYRLSAIALGALGLLVTGWRMRESRALYAQILQGGGIAGLYLTVYATARLYELVPASLALPLLMIVAIAAALLAVAQNALPLAVIGFAGGFLAPVLLSTGSGNHIALFSYYTVLNVGVFIVAWFRAWRLLNLVGLVFTFVITGAWRALAYTPEKLVSADFFLLLFFAMYVAISILFALRQKPELRGYVSASLVFGLPIVVFALHATMISRIEYGMAWSALGFGVFYLLLAAGVHAARHPNMGLLAEAFAALGVIFASLAIPLAFDEQTTAAMSSIEGAGLLWLGVRQDRKFARAFGVLLQALAGANYLIGLPFLDATPPLLNSACIGAAMLAVSGLWSGRLLHGSQARLASYEQPFAVIALLWGTAWWLLGGLDELDRSAADSIRYGLALAFGGLTLAGLSVLQRRWSWHAPGRLALTLMPLMAVAGQIAMGPGDHPFRDLAYLGWPLLLAAMVFLLWQWDHSDDPVLGELKPSVHSGTCLLLALVTAQELGWHIAQISQGVWKTLPWAWVPMVLLWLAHRPPSFLKWPLHVHRLSYQLHVSIPLVVWAVAWLVVVNLFHNGDPRPLGYLPLLNPLDVSSISLLLTLLGCAASLTPELRARLWPDGPQTFIGAYAALAFLWLNAALLRAIHYSLGTPLQWHAIRHSFVAQASLSILWTLLALAVMTIAARRGWRKVWMVGAALMGVVATKLFLIDLDGTGSLARIASFISVGGLMLLAGYLSPLPPDKNKELGTHPI